MEEWINWSGSLKFYPGQIAVPEDEQALQKIIKSHYDAGKKIKLAAAGHSSSPLVKTDHTLVNLREFKGLKRINEDATVSLSSGMTVHESNMVLQQHGLALFNTGDVDVQTLAGAISTGTHGSGRRLQNLASALKGVRMIDYKGDIHVFDDKGNPEIMRAMRVSLGALGIFTEIKVAVVPLFELRRMEFFTDVETCLDHFDALADENRNVDFYWYPRSDEVKMRILNEPGKGTVNFGFKFYCRKEEQGFVGEILPKKRKLKFDEMEYALAREAGIECFHEIRKRVKSRHRKSVAWRILFRVIAPDDNYLSPHFGRESVSISLHHNAGLSYDEYFSDIEPIFIHFGGRPHWAKKHNLKADQLRALYPEWSAYQTIRKSLDPQGAFMNDHLYQLFGEEKTL